MTEQEYAELAQACDQLLRADDTSVARLAIPPLHLINEHPSCIADYEAALHPGLTHRDIRQFPAWEDLLRGVARAARAVMRAGLHTARVSTPASSPHRVDVLLVSHLVNPSQLDREDDAYLGPLQRLLRECGATSVLALVNHLPTWRTPHADAMPTRLVLPNAIPPLIEARVWQQCVRARHRLRQTTHQARSRTERMVAGIAARHAWLEPTAKNLRLHWQISELSKSLRPRIVLTTYEGVGCERLIWHAARSDERKPLCVGYQFTRLLPRSHAILRRLRIPRIACDPDVILTLGDVTHTQLARSAGLLGTKLIKYGSHRRLTVRETPPPQQRPQCCLVLPDADPYECAILFGFAIEAARQLPTVAFALRPHQGTNVKSLATLVPQLRALPPNVSVSNSVPLEEHCLGARYCLYRGSSAVMQAAVAGVKPFYVRRKGELSFDVLGTVRGWHEMVSTPTEFAARVAAPSESWDAEGARRTAEFCSNYIGELRPQALKELLDLATR